ncbi:cytochrome P450 [Micromonospora sp. M12]
MLNTAIEELLRYDAPIQLSGRVPMEDIEIDGQTLRKGQMVGVVLGAANRDERAFTDPHELDLGRSPNNHVAFGRGLHFCLGAPLAGSRAPPPSASWSVGSPGYVLPVSRSAGPTRTCGASPACRWR